MKKPYLIKMFLIAMIIAAGCESSVLTETESPMASSSAAMAASDGAIVIKFDDTLCFLPAVDENGGVYIVSDIQCDVKVTNTPSGNVNFRITKASVPNDYGKAVPITFGDPVAIPCQIFTGSEFIFTENYQFTVAANGNISGVCHLPE